MATKSGRRVFRGAEQWREMLSRFEKSGLSRQVFCEQEGVGVSTFGNWQRRLRQKDASLFVEISPEASRVTWDMELDLGNGVVLRMRRA